MALDPLNNINESISEVEAAQDPLSAFNRMFSEVNTGIPTNPYPVISAPIPRTTSTAVDINQNLVGNEVTGPAPGVNNTTPQGNKSFVDSALDYMDNAETWAKDEYKYGRTYSYGAGWKNMQFERFYTHPNYKKLGFSPYRNNEELYNENSTWMDDWRRSSHQYWKLLSNAFGSSLFGSDDFKGAETMQEGLALGSSSKEGIGSSITNFGLSSMYTLGMGAEILAENVALSFVEAGALLLAPETLGATLPTVAAAAVRQTSNLARFSKGLENTYEFVKGLRQIEKAREFFNLAKVGKAGLAAAKYLNPLQKSFEFTTFLAKGEKVWSTSEKIALAAHGFGHFFKDLREISLVSEEAGLEGAMARSEYHQKLIDEYYAKNGKMPEGQAAQEIYEKAASVDFSVGMANMPAIYLSNKIVFEKYLKGFPTMSSVAKSVEKESNRYLVNVATGEVLEKGAYEFAEKSTKRKVGEFLMSSAYVPWSKEYFTANMTEALQENLQDAISTAVKSYHDKIDSDPTVAGFWEGLSQFGTGVKGQFNKQGLETLLSGYFTGFLVGGLGGTATSIATSIQSRTKSGQAKVQAAKERRTERENTIKDSVNAMAMDAINIGARNATSASEVKNHAEESDKAASEDNNYKYNSSKDKMFTDHSYNLAAANKTELFTSHIDDMLNLQDEDLTKAYGAKLDEAQDVRKRLNNAKERALDIKNTYEQVKEEFPNPVDLSMLDPKKNEVLYEKMLAKYNAHEFAIKTITTSTEALNRTNARLIGIVNEFSQASPWINVRRGAQQVNNAGASDITALMDGYQREELIKVLKLEISTLKEGTAEQKKEAKIKQEKLEALESWETIVSGFNQLGKKREALLKEKNQDLSEVTDYINLLTKEIYPIFDKYTKVIAKEQGGTLISKELGKAFIKIRDYHLLESDSNSYTAALNVLNDPLYFDRFISAVEIAETELQKTKAERIAQGYTKFMGYLDMEEYNDFLNEIYDQGMFVIPESIEDFIKDPRTAKFGLYDIASKEPVKPGTPKYEAFEKLLNETYPIKEEVVTEEVKTEVTEEGVAAQKAISVTDDINTMPKELQEELIKKYESVKTYFAEERPDVKFPYYNFDQFLKRAPEAKQIIEAYNKKNNLKPVVEKKEIPTKEQKVSTVISKESTEEISKDTAFTKEQELLREKNIELIDKTIKALTARKKLSETNLTAVKDTIEYLKNLLDNTAELTNIDIDKLLTNIKTLESIVGSKSKKKTQKGKLLLNSIEDYKNQIKSEQQLLNDIADRIKELSEQVVQYESIIADFNNQINYYNNLLVDKNFKELSADELKSKIKAIKRKRSVIEKLIDALRDIIRKSFNYIKDYVSITSKTVNSFEKFTKTTGFKPVDAKELRKIVDGKSDISAEDYFKLKAEYENFEKNISDNLDTIDLLEEVKDAEKQRLDDLYNKLRKYDDQIRYLENLISIYESNIKTKIPGKSSVSAPKPISKAIDVDVKIEEQIAKKEEIAKQPKAKKTESVKVSVTPVPEAPVSDKTIEINNNRNRNKEQKNAGAPVLDGYSNAWFAYYTPEGPENKVSFKTQQKALDWIDSKYDAELDALEGAKPAAKPVEEVTTASVQEVKERLKALNEKTLIVSPSNKKVYIDIQNPEDEYKRVTNLTGDKTFNSETAATRGTIIDALLRRFIIKPFEKEEIKSIYNAEIKKLEKKHQQEQEALGEEEPFVYKEFSDNILENLFNIFEEVKKVADEKGLTLISDIPTLWGILNGEKYAGTIDLLGISKTGEVYIIDLKTSGPDRRVHYAMDEFLKKEGGDLYDSIISKIKAVEEIDYKGKPRKTNNILAVEDFTKEEKIVADKFIKTFEDQINKYGSLPVYDYRQSDAVQQSAYAELLRQRTGITVKNIVVFPITVKETKQSYISAIANKDDKGAMTMQVTVDRNLFPEQALSPEAPEIVEKLEEPVEEAPDDYISPKEAVRNKILVRLGSLRDQMKIDRNPDNIKKALDKIENEVAEAELPYTEDYALAIDKIIQAIRKELKSVSRVEIGDYIIFENNPSSRFVVVDKNDKEITLYNDAIPAEERVNTEPEILTNKDMYKISKIISAETPETEELTPEEKEINVENVKAMDEFLKNDELINSILNSKQSEEEVDKEFLEGLDNCNIQ